MENEITKQKVNDNMKQSSKRWQEIYLLFFFLSAAHCLGRIKFVMTWFVQKSSHNRWNLKEGIYPQGNWKK